MYSKSTAFSAFAHKYKINSATGKTNRHYAHAFRLKKLFLLIISKPFQKKLYMKNLLLAIGVALCAPFAAFADNIDVKSPDGKLAVTIENTGGKAYYSATLNGKQMIESSQLGVYTDVGDFTTGLTMTGSQTSSVSSEYTMTSTKASQAHYKANCVNVDFENGKKQKMTITFNVSDNNIAFRYSFPQYGETRVMTITGEATSFRLPAQTTTFLCPQNKAMSGWMRTKPCYEEEYKLEMPMSEPSAFGEGYTFPCLFRIGGDGWALVSETGTCGNYVGCHLSDYNAEKGYTIAFPMPGESNGIGQTSAGVALPYSTPWRTITLGETLKPLVETTIAYDVVEPMYQTTRQYKPGRYTWSWLLWQDGGTNYDDQVKFIDMSERMGYEYVLIDANWDQTIGYERMEELSKYAQSKGVGLILWYSTNGTANDPPQTPRHKMSTSFARNKEMAWLQKAGIKGIKVDYFGGDKQHTMQYYEDILVDAARYGICVIFHGCTLPRGWERMFPNFVSSEAVLASENVYFTDHAARRQAMELTIHPFCRNAVATMDWGGIIMNKNMSRDNKSRHPRYTSDIFELASGITNQTSIQCVAIYPNTIDEIPDFEIDFLKELPTVWDETQFIDGYPGKFVILARRHGDKWYVAGLNATGEEMKLKLQLPMFAGKTLMCYNDKPAKEGALSQPQLKEIKAGKDGTVKVTIQPNGGLILK